MAIYPALDVLLTGADPAKLLEVRRSLRSILSNLAIFAAAVIIFYLLIYFFGNAKLSEQIPILRHFSMRWLVLIPIGILLEIVRRYHDDLYVIGQHRATHYNGRLSLKYNVPVIKYSDIRSMKVDQDIFGRIFDYGTIEIDTAAQEGGEMFMEGVRDPYALMRLLEELRLNSIRELKSQNAQNPDIDVTGND